MIVFLNLLVTLGIGYFLLNHLKFLNRVKWRGVYTFWTVGEAIVICFAFICFNLAAITAVGIWLGE